MRNLTYREYHNMRPTEFEPGDKVPVKIVAVISPDGVHWAAYAGLSDWTDARVASSGDKIRPEAAEALFPSIAARFTWRR